MNEPAMAKNLLLNNNCNNCKNNNDHNSKSGPVDSCKFTFNDIKRKEGICDKWEKIITFEKCLLCRYLLPSKEIDSKNKCGLLLQDLDENLICPLDEGEK